MTKTRDYSYYKISIKNRNLRAFHVIKKYFKLAYPNYKEVFISENMLMTEIFRLYLSHLENNIPISMLDEFENDIARLNE